MISSVRQAVRETGPDAQRLPLSELQHYGELLRSLVIRNLKVKYQRSVLGFVWALVNPAATILVLIVVFGYLLQLPVENYWALLVSGFFVWNFGQQVLQASTIVLKEHGGLRRAVAFPTEILIFSSVIARLIEFGAEILLAIALLAIFHHGGIPASFLLLPLFVVLVVLTLLGIAMVVSTLAVFYYDTQHIVMIATFILFYLSPVFYPASLVPEQYHWLYFLNPFAGLLTLFHIALYEGRMPSLVFTGAVAAASLAIFLIGYAIFNRYKSLFAEIL